MRVPATVAVVTLFLFIFSLPCRASQQGGFPQPRSNSQKTQPESGQISGHVYRADDGTPVARAAIILTMDTEIDGYHVPEQQSVRTGDDGAYRFPQLIPGKYTVVAEHPGYASRVFSHAGGQPNERTITLVAGQAVDDVDVRLFIGGTISGTVFDDENQPLEGQPVDAIRLTYHRGGQTEEAVARTAKTDDAGNFRLYGLPPGEYYVRVLNLNNYFESRSPKSNDAGPAYRSAYYPGTPTLENATKLSVQGGNAITDVQFSIAKQSTYTIYGNIIDSTASVVPKRYFISPGHFGSGVLGLPDSPPSADGSFAIQGAPSGEYILWAFAMQNGPATDRERQTHFSSGGKMIQVSDSDVHTDVQIGPRGEIDGSVIIENSSGQSVSGIGVTLLSEFLMKFYNPFNNMFDTTTDQKGRFRIDRVETGRYIFSLRGSTDLYLKKAACKGIDYTFRQLTMEAGATVGSCVLTLAGDSGVIKGQVLNGDRPVSDEVVIAIPEASSLRHLARYTITGLTRTNGEYQLSGVIPGDYLLFALPLDDAETYFDINFADRNLRDAARVSVKSSETKIVPLKPTSPQ